MYDAILRCAVGAALDIPLEIVILIEIVIGLDF